MGISGNALVMKEVNINLVRRTLKLKRQATKQQLAQETGLSIVTVGTVLQQLVQDGEAYEVEAAASSGGRPAQQFRFNENYAHALIIFMHEESGLATAHVRVVNLFGESVYAENRQLQSITLECFEPFIDVLLVQYPTIRAIGIGLPGAEYEGRMILIDYNELIGLPIVDHYKERYGLPVLVENDVNAAVIGYCRRRQVTNAAATVYIYFPANHCPGSGIYIDGKLYKGCGGFAGEVGSIPLGIDWDNEAFNTTPALFCAAVAKLIVAVCSIINPYAITLHSKLLTPELLEDIASRCAKQLPKSVVPVLGLSQNFTLDYQYGMAFETLALLEPQIYLTI